MIIFLLLLSVCNSIHGEEKNLPPYLTPDDFELANKKGFGDGINEKSYNPPENDIEFESSSRTDYWRHSGIWKNAKVIYTLNSNLNAHDRSEIALAIKNIEENTCVRFEPKGDRDITSVDIHVDDTVCGLATLCPWPGGYAKFGQNCRNWKTMVHELLHTLCYTHEFERNDRDQWMNVGCGSEAVNTVDYVSQELLFDYRSASNYHCDDCRVARMQGVKECGSSIGMSVLDADKVNSLYDCRGCLGYRWKNGKSNPLRPFVGGYDINKVTFYPCRAYMNGDIIPGKGAPDWGCYVSYHGGEHFVSDHYDILTNPNGANLQWKKRTGNQVPSGAIKGGRTEGQETLYIGRCLKKHPKNGQESQVIGKIHLSANPNGMYVPFDRLEQTCLDHEVLVCE